MDHLTEQQIINGYWHWGLNKPPQACKRVEEYSGEKFLAINCTQLEGFSAKEQKKIINDWCEFLSSPTEIEIIWFVCRVNQELFDAVCNQNQLQGLYIKWSGVKTIKQIPQLENLKYLKIGSSSKIVDISPLTSLHKLIFLYLNNLQRVHDYSVISELKQLEGLCLTGNVFAPQILKIDSLKFLECLHNLKYLDLDTTKILDNSHDAICNLTDLRTFQINRTLPKDLRIKIKGTLKKLQYGFFMEYDWENKRRYNV
jgi:hypothetical protein